MSCPSEERLAVACLLAGVAMAASLGWWVAIDDAVFQFIQFARSCALDRVERTTDPAVRAGLVLLFVAAMWAGNGHRRPGHVLQLLLVFALGAFLCELFKTGIERLRPNSTPSMISGNSFPSGHVMNVTLAAAASLRLAAGRERPRLVSALMASAASALIVAQALARMVAGSHWLSDVITSVFLGFGLVLATGWIVRRSLAVHIAALAFAAAAYVFFDSHPAARWRVPSAMDESRPPLAAVEFGMAEPGADLVGSWRAAPPEPVGPVAWVMSSEAGVRLSGDLQGARLLKILVRPPSGERNNRVCAHITISINAWTAPPITLQRGWREYRIEPPAGVLARAENRIDFRIDTDRSKVRGAGDAGLVAVRYLRLYGAS